MTDWRIAEEIMDFVLQLFHKDDIHGIEKWNTFTPTHATQFFEFVKQIAEAATDGNQVRVPPVFIQPIAAEDIATAFAKVAVGPPMNGMVEVGGEERLRFDEFIRARSARSTKWSSTQMRSISALNRTN